MMTKTSLSILALSAAALSTPALAGGFIEPVAAPAPIIVAPEPVANWAGTYGGAYLGYGEDDTDSDLGTPDASGAVGGFVLGHNWQSGRWVYGIEGTLGTSDYSGTFEKAGGDTSIDVGTTVGIRGRLGYDMGVWMPYATLGASWADSDYDQYNAAGAKIASDSEFMSGYSIGLGAEYRLNQKWSMTGEYIYTTYDSDFKDGPVDSSIDHDTSEVRVGVNYHF